MPIEIHDNCLEEVWDRLLDSGGACEHFGYSMLERLPTLKKTPELLLVFLESGFCCLGEDPFGPCSSGCLYKEDNQESD